MTKADWGTSSAPDPISMENMIHVFRVTRGDGLTVSLYFDPIDECMWRCEQGAGYIPQWYTTDRLR